MNVRLRLAKVAQLFITNFFLNMMRKLYVWLLTCMVMAIMSSQGMAQDRQLSGRILDENQKGLPGASVLIKNTNKGTSADAEGNFSIAVSGSGVLIVSSLGYEPQEISFNGAMTLSLIHI